MIETEGDASARIDTGLARILALPVGLLILFILAQSIPLPPAALHAISPATYRFYSRAYPDWPRGAPYEIFNTVAHETSPLPGFRAPDTLPSKAEVLHESKVPFAPPANVPTLFAQRWRPLSIAWPLTTTALIGAVALAALLFAMVFYPAGTGRGVREQLALTRVVMIAILVTGLVVALVGLVQWATWNGKILWVMVPYDWGVPNLSEAARRACGPFVNPDHFAGYLAMIFPLMLSGLIFGGFPARSNSGLAVRVAYGFATFLIFTAVALSQSRAGWIGLAVGALLLITFVQWYASESPLSRAKIRKVNPLSVSVAILAALLVLALMFVGTQGREQTAGRFGDTVLRGGIDLHERFTVWASTPRIFREFPLFGVGMGAWPEIFFRFQPTPRSDLINNAAHNDYFELLVDAGLIGVGLLGWLILGIGARLRKAMRSLPAHLVPALAAIISGLIVMGIIELVDFDLHIPANLILFTLLAALGLRMSARQPTEAGPESERRFGRLLYLPVGAAILLAVGALRQTGAPYPYDIVEPRTLADARNLLLTYPANPAIHRSILRQFGTIMSPGARSREIETWLWLDPTNPNARDIYAADLVERGRRADAMNQISQSTYVSPDARTHPYMSPRILPLLADDQKRAIENGLTRAVAERFDGAVIALSDFYDTLGRTSDRARLLTQAAAHEQQPQRRAQYLREGADAYLAIGDSRKAGEFLQRAIDTDPGDARNYTDLIAKVLVPHEEYDQARRVIDQGIENDADACRLALSMAPGAAQRGRRDIAEQALSHALETDPASYDCTVELSRLYNGEGRYARAMLMMETATRLRPDSAQAYLELAAAAERNYDYSAAEKAYDRAASLAPQNPAVAESVAAFKRKLSEAGAGSEQSK